MEIGVYVKNPKQLSEIQTNNVYPQWIFFGDYGCYKRIPDLDELKQAAAGMKVRYHYISPKVNMALMEYEYKKVMRFLKQGIAVSINDLGLLYKMHKEIEAGELVYLGRLLTRSVNRWVWGELHVAEEDEIAKKYFVQNNFYQYEKMELFNEWNVRGIETSVFQKEEESLKKIKGQGFEIVGFVDQTIAAVSRACPIARDKGVIVKGVDCSCYCMEEEYQVQPSNAQQRERYPELKLEGTVLMKKITPSLAWNGYERVVFSDFTEEIMTYMKKMQEVCS